MAELAPAEGKQTVVKKEPRSSAEEGAVLKCDYSLMMASRWILGVDLDSNPLPDETAYMRELERGCFQIPEEVMFEDLKRDIPEEHQARMELIWSALRRTHNAWQGTLKHWKKEIRAAPGVAAPETVTIVETRVSREQASLHRYLCAVVHWSQSSSRQEKSEVLSVDAEAQENIFDESRSTIDKLARSFRERLDQCLVATLGRLGGKLGTQGYADKRLGEWQFREKSDRQNLFFADKNYLTALRLYLEMLLEKPKREDAAEGPAPVLPLDHAERMDIVKLNRAARCVDTEHQFFAIAKAIHHAQPEGRLRESGEAYLWHVWRVVKQAMYDVVPYVIEEEKLALNPVLLIAAGALHDVPEDSELGLQDIYENYIKRLADKYDSSLDQHIKSGFSVSRTKIKTKCLDLIGEGEWKELRKILRVLSDNAELTPEEKKFGVENNFAGQGHTARLLSANDDQLKRWGIDLPQGTRPVRRSGDRQRTVELLPPPLKVFSQIPPAGEQGDKHLKKLDKFIIRLETVLQSDDLKQYALIVKMEDRANNLMDYDHSKPKSQRAKLYATATRLIAYAMLDYPLDKQPLYNALPRLIDVTLTGYRVLETQCTDPKTNEAILSDKDTAVIVQLQEWKESVRRFSTSPPHEEDLPQVD